MLCSCLALGGVSGGAVLKGRFCMGSGSSEAWAPRLVPAGWVLFCGARPLVGLACGCLCLRLAGLLALVSGFRLLCAVPGARRLA